MSEPTNRRDNKVPTRAQQLRRWRESIGIEACARALLIKFRESRSPVHRAKIWNALLEVLSIEEENLSETLFRQWTDELLRALTNSNPEIRCQGLSALADVAPYVSDRAEVMGSLVQCLYDESENVRSRAIYTVFSFNDHRLLVAIADSLNSNDSRKPVSDDPDRCRLWHALFALDGVIDKSDLTSEEENMIAARVFNALSSLLNEPFASDFDIWKVGDSLGEHIKGKAALNVLEEMVTHADPRVRDSAVHGLSHLGGAKAVALIKRSLADPIAEVREEARKALITAADCAGHYQRP